MRTIPRTGAALGKYFTSDGYWKPWNNADYDRDAKMISDRCQVTVAFTDSTGAVSSYAFTAGSGSSAVAVGTWKGNVP